MSDTEQDTTLPTKTPPPPDTPSRGQLSPPPFNPYLSQDYLPTQPLPREDLDLGDPTDRPPHSILKNTEAKAVAIQEATTTLKEAHDKLAELMKNQNLTIEMRGRSSSLPPSSKRKAKSPRMSRQSSRDSIFNIDNVHLDKNIAGLTRQLHPLAAAGRIGLDPSRYSEEIKRKVARDITAQTKPEVVRKNFQDEINRFDYTEQFMESPPQLHDNLHSTTRAPVSNVKAFNEKLRAYGKKQRADSDTIADFVKDFVGAVNAFELNEKQASEIFPGYFEGSLRHEIEQDIRNQGLQLTIDRLFQFKCAQNTRQELKLALQNFQFHNNSLRSDIFDFQALYKRVHGPKNVEILDEYTRQKIENQLSAEALRTLNAIESQYYEDKGKDMAFMRWVHTILCSNLKLLPNRKIAAVKKVSCEDLTNLQQKIENLELQQRLTSETQCNTHQKEEETVVEERDLLTKFKEAYLQGFRDSQDTYISGVHQIQNDRGNSKTVTPIKPGGAAFAAAADKFPLKTLVSKNNGNYPDNNRVNLPYRMVGNFFVPDEKVVQVPEVPTFFALPNGNAVVNSALRNHFRTRCATCGMKGHSSEHPSCPLRDSDATWDLCGRCKAGYHSKCKLHADHWTPFH